MREILFKAKLISLVLLNMEHSFRKEVIEDE